MLKRSLVSLFVLLCLPSCLLDQTAPKPPPSPASGQTLGLVVMEDIGGQQAEADVIALFGKDSGSKAIARYGRAFSVRATSPCELSQKPVDNPPPKPSADTTITLVSVGKLGLGPALTHTLLVLDESAQHAYTRKLDPDFPAGVYQLVAEGAGSVGQFTEVMSMPEALRAVKANATGFGTTDVIIHRNEPLTVEWEAPAVLNDESVILIDVGATTETTAYTLECAMMEKDLYTSAATLQWQIPAEELSKLPASPHGQVQVQRLQQLNMTSGVVNGKMQGVRVQLAPASLN